MEATHLALIGTLLTVVVTLTCTVVVSRRQGSEEIGAGQLFLPTVAALAAVVTQSVVLFGSNAVTGFGIFNLFYQHLVIGIPLVGIGLLTARWWAGLRCTRFTTVAMIATLLLLPSMGYYATFVEPFRLEVDEERLIVAAEREGDDPVVVGVLSDIQADHLVDHHFDAVAEVMSYKPDIILIAGDFHQGDDTFVSEQPNWKRLLGMLDAPGGVFAVRGDTDRVEALEQMFDGTEVQLLADDVITTQVGDRPVMIGGVTLHQSPAGEAVVNALQVPGPQLRLLLGHRPDWVLELPTHSRVDLTVAGHTHGGQIAVPFIGPIVTISDVPRKVAAGGLHEVDGNAIYVSSGVGWEHIGAPRVRFLAPPSVGIVTLTAP